MLKLLDTTLRDGSYIVDFQFSADDTAVIAAALDAHHVHYIEVGHGIGLGAFRNPRTQSAEPDDRYLAAAARAVKQNRWGMFFIPGVASMDDLDRAADHGMHFVRIGTNVTETEQATRFITRAKQLGMLVFANFMKTYAASPAQVADRAVQVAGDGADVVCVVDSAGGMLPEDVTAYIAAIRSRVGIDVGYHGHNNLGMAVANTLVAVEQGATVIDTSLRGMGRSAGNASTEMTLFALLRRGVDLGIDPVAMLTIAEQRIDPLLARAAQERSIGVVTGFAQFHSSYLDIVEEVARERHVDPRELIIGVTRENKIDAPRALVERVADQLARTARPRSRISASTACSSPAPLSRSLAARVGDLAARLRTAARRGSRISVLNVVQSLRGEAAESVSTSLHEGAEAIVATVEIASAASAAVVLQAADGVVDYLLVDTDNKLAESEAIVAALSPARSGLLRYSDLAAWTTSVLDIIAEVRNAPLTHSRIVVVGERSNPLALAMRDAARARGAVVRLTSGRGVFTGRDVDSVIVCGPHDQALVPHPSTATNGGATQHTPPLLMDAWIGGVSAAEARAFRDGGAHVLRPDMRPALHAEISRALSVRDLVSQAAGFSIFEGIAIAAGGVVAPRGTIVVDSIARPSAVHGVANGAGALQDIRELDDESAELLDRARTLVLHSVG